MSDREQHDAEFTSYIERVRAYEGVGDPSWLVVYKGMPQGVYPTREQARKKIRSLKPFSAYRLLKSPVVPEEAELSPEMLAKVAIVGRPWGRFTRVLRDVFDLDPVC